jgi:hypothetical protein
MSAEDVTDVRNALDEKGAMHVLRFEDDPLCTPEKSECIQKAFNDDGAIRIDEITLPGKGHSVLTLDFVDEEGHPTHEALASVLHYFRKLFSSDVDNGDVSEGP